MKVHIASTAPINPAGATPVLTHAQAFKALQIKAERPQAFVPIIDTCEVISRSATGLTRKITMKPGAAGAPAQGAVTEEIVFLHNSNVTFHMLENGSRVQNVISRGPGGETDLYLTFVGEFTVDGIGEGTPEADKRKEEMFAMFQKVVPGSVIAARDLVVKGEI